MDRKTLTKPPLNNIVNGFFLVLFFFAAYFLLCCWKDHDEIIDPFSVVMWASLSELTVLFSLFASLLYLLLGFFSIYKLAATHQHVVMDTEIKFLEDEDVVRYVQIPVGVVGPLLLDGEEYFVPVATTEGCLVASANRGCKAVYLSGGSYSTVLRDGMTRTPVVRFKSAKRAAQVKLFVEDPKNFDTFAAIFLRSSVNGRLQSIKSGMAGKNLYMRFSYITGDNGDATLFTKHDIDVVSKAVQDVFAHLHTHFPDMDVITISADGEEKKAAAVNWVEGAGKSVVCEATIKEEVVNKVLKTSVETLVELNTLKNLVGSAVAGCIGGFNAHASNIVTAIFIATGQDPALNVASSNCITLLEAVGNDLHISVTMPSIQVESVGGGTELASQAACLNLVGVKGATKDKEGENSRKLARIVAASVLAGELSLLSAIAAGQLVNSHLKYNRSTNHLA
ncbi:unnamed protein product [Amaranthus hypochondriacus]